MKWEIQRTEIEHTYGIHDLYLIFRCTEDANAYSLSISSWELEYQKNCMMPAVSFSKSSTGIINNMDSEVILLRMQKMETILFLIILI